MPPEWASVRAIRLLHKKAFAPQYRCFKKFAQIIAHNFNPLPTFAMFHTNDTSCKGNARPTLQTFGGLYILASYSNISFLQLRARSGFPSHNPALIAAINLLFVCVNVRRSAPAAYFLFHVLGKSTVIA